jgi:hypothetical protein
MEPNRYSHVYVASPAVFNGVRHVPDTERPPRTSSGVGGLIYRYCHNRYPYTIRCGRIHLVLHVNFLNSILRSKVLFIDTEEPTPRTCVY